MPDVAAQYRAAIQRPWAQHRSSPTALFATKLVTGRHSHRVPACFAISFLRAFQFDPCVSRAGPEGTPASMRPPDMARLTWGPREFIRLASPWLAGLILLCAAICFHPACCRLRQPARTSGLLQRPSSGSGNSDHRHPALGSPVGRREPSACRSVEDYRTGTRMISYCPTRTRSNSQRKPAPRSRRSCTGPVLRSRPTSTAGALASR